MAATSAQIVDFQAYRQARRQAATPAATAQSMAAFNAYQPMVMWVPVWAYFPFAVSPWVHAQ